MQLVQHIYRFLLVAFLMVATFYSGFAQSELQDTSSQSVVVDHADLLQYQQSSDTVRQKLIGQIVLHQDSVYMYCDTATITNDRYVFALGDILIQQGDSLAIFSDSLFYDGDMKMADLYGNVILNYKNQKLFTNHLTYDLNKKEAVYSDRALLTNDSTQLQSIQGRYLVEEDRIFFKDSVTVIDSNFVLIADSLVFNPQTRMVDFTGPTLINSDSTKIYCQDGFYDINNSKALFTDDPQFINNNQKARADTIIYDGELDSYELHGHARYEKDDQRADAEKIVYDAANDVVNLYRDASFVDLSRSIVADTIIYNINKETYSTYGSAEINDENQILKADQLDYSDGVAFAKGNVIWQDTTAEMSILCGEAEYEKESGYLKATGGRGGRPMLITIMDDDSLYMTSDTLYSMRQDTSGKDDSTRLLLAYRDVRIFKSDLQALCDSLSYSTADSVFSMYYSPIMWSDTSQFIADTMDVLMANGSIDKILMKDNAFIINSPDQLYFNQIKGKNVTAYFDSSELRKMYIDGSAQTVYYGLDEEEAYIGVNKTLSSEMMLAFGNNKVESIRFFDQPQATFYPMQKADHAGLRLKGFKWNMEERPQSFDDLFGPPLRVLVRKAEGKEVLEMQEVMPDKTDVDEKPQRPEGKPESKGMRGRN